MKQQVWCMEFVNKISISLLDEEMTLIKFKDIDELRNFHVHEFFIWNNKVSKKFVQSSNIFKFKIQAVETKSYYKSPKIKMVDLTALHNFVSDIFYIWWKLLLQKTQLVGTTTNIEDPLSRT
jgi:hypothetical protein